MTTILVLIYLADVAFTIKVVAFITAVISFVVGALAISWAVTEGWNNKLELLNMKTLFKVSVTTLILSVFLLIAVPQANTIYTITALKAGSIGVENIKGSEIYNKAMILINQKLDELIKETK